MTEYKEFKSEVDKFIDFMNNRMKTYDFYSAEEYDNVIDKTIIEYYRGGNTSLVFYDMEYFEENLDKYGGVNPYSITHCYADEWGGPRDGTCPREHTLDIKSICGEYEACITTITLMHRPYLYKKLLTKYNIFIPQFFLLNIEKLGNNRKYLYEINHEDRYNYDPLK